MPIFCEIIEDGKKCGMLMLPKKKDGEKWLECKNGHKRALDKDREFEYILPDRTPITRDLLDKIYFLKKKKKQMYPQILMLLKQGKLSEAISILENLYNMSKNIGVRKLLKDFIDKLMEKEADDWDDDENEENGEDEELNIENIEFGEPFEEEVEEEAVDEGKQKEKKKEVEGVDYIVISIAGKKVKFPFDPNYRILSAKQWNIMTKEEVDEALKKGF